MSKDAAIETSPRNFFIELFKTQYDSGKGLNFTSRVSYLQVISRMGGRCFQFKLQDGFVLEPSLKYCFEKRPDNTAIAKRCFRDITWPFCLAYRTKYFAGRDMAPCELTGRMTTPSRCEVDHQHPDTFEKLLADFLVMKQIRIDDVEIVKAEPKWLLKDSSLAEEWQRHHDSHAVLRVLDTAAHVEHTKSLQLASLAA